MLLQWLKVQHIDQEVVGSTHDKPKCMSSWQSCGSTLRIQCIILRSILGWSPSSILPRPSRRLSPFRLFRILVMFRHSVTAADFLVWSTRIRIRFSLNRHASSSTRFPCGPSCHNTNILLRPLFADFRPWLPLLVEGPELLSTLPICLLSCSCSAPTIASQPTSSSTPTGPFLLRVQHPVVRLSCPWPTRMLFFNH